MDLRPDCRIHCHKCRLSQLAAAIEKAEQAKSKARLTSVMQNNSDEKRCAVDPARIRLLEAVSFRSFPATTTHYDGTWAIRLTAGHPAKRLNSVNPLDPNDSLDLENRINRARQKFKSFGRPLVFRLTPLAPAGLTEIFHNQGWQVHEESIVMELDLAKADIADAIDQLPLKDPGRWADEYISLSNEETGLKPGLVEVIGATEPETGLFVHYDNEIDRNELSLGEAAAASVVRCVWDRSLAGVFDLVTDKDQRHRGNGRNIMKTALLWARRKGAKKAWLQVVAENEAANQLYGSLGFREVYRYRYWKPADE